MRRRGDAARTSTGAGGPASSKPGVCTSTSGPRRVTAAMWKVTESCGRSAGQLPGGAKHPRGLRQAGRVQGAFDFEKGDAPAVRRDDHLPRRNLQGRDGLGDKGGAQGLPKRRQVGKRAVGRLTCGAPCGRRLCPRRCGREQGLQAVDVFRQHRLLVEAQEALDGLLFCRARWGRRASTGCPGSPPGSQPLRNSASPRSIKTCGTPGQRQPTGCVRTGESIAIASCYLRRRSRTDSISSQGVDFRHA